MTPQEASAAIAALLKQADAKIKEARQIADAEGVPFQVNVGGVRNDYVPQKFLDIEDDEEMERIADEAGVWNYNNGYDGWQSSSC